jgi:hypothetical protein
VRKTVSGWRWAPNDVPEPLCSKIEFDVDLQ